MVFLSSSFCYPIRRIITLDDQAPLLTSTCFLLTQVQRVHLPVNAHFAHSPHQAQVPTAEVYSFTIRIEGIDVHIVLRRTCALYMHKFTEFGVTIYTGSVWYDTIQFGMVWYFRCNRLHCVNSVPLPNRKWLSRSFCRQPIAPACYRRSLI